MRKKSVRKVFTMVLAMTLILSASTITAFAANEDNQGQEATCDFTTETCTKEDCPVHGGETDQESENTKKKSDNSQESDDIKKSEDEKASGNGSDKGTNRSSKNKDTISGNDSKNTDTVSGNDTEKENNKKDESSMNADVAKEDAETVKTGEVNMIPVIIGLAVIAASAGGIYVIYKKKQNKA